MRNIPLSQGFFAVVDDEDYDRVSQYKWSVNKRSYTNYATRSVRINGKKKNQYLHRLLMNAPKGTDVDHIDGNGLNCQRSNMRLATRQQNIRNYHKAKGSSGIKGVRIRHYGKKTSWVARIVVGPKQEVCLGSFDTKEEAITAYNAVAAKYFGEFACSV